MSRHIRESTKIAQGRCAKIGIDWKPWIQAQEFSSIGTRALPIDWVTGRTVHCLSQVERSVFFVLRWNSQVDFNCEQARLDRSSTAEIADRFGFRHVNNDKTCMTTDFLVIMKSGKIVAVSVKNDRGFLTSNEQRDIRQRERLIIEQTYFEDRGIPWCLVFKDNINQTLVHNINIVTEYYDSNRIHDRISYIKHLIAHKQLDVDMESDIIDFILLERMIFND